MKKQSMIMEMFNGRRGRYDQIPMTDEYWELMHVAGEREEIFLAALGKREELIELFQKTKDGIEAMWSSECNSCFCEGFRCGVLLGLDILEGK